jgi:uncharacterized protein YhfF
MCHDGGMDIDRLAEESDDPHSEESDLQLQEFWTVAQRYAHVGDLDVFMGKQWSQSLAPPAWAFGDSPELANELLQLVLNGSKRATTGLYQEYIDEDEPLPHVGDLSILLDGEGKPRALIRDTKVALLGFGDVTAKQAAAEGEGDGSLEFWRTEHLQHWQRRGYVVDDDTQVVWEQFKVLYQA